MGYFPIDCSEIINISRMGIKKNEWLDCYRYRVVVYTHCQHLCPKVNLHNRSPLKSCILMFRDAPMPFFFFKDWVRVPLFFFFWYSPILIPIPMPIHLYSTVRLTLWASHKLKEQKFQCPISFKGHNYQYIFNCCYIKRNLQTNYKQYNKYYRDTNWINIFFFRYSRFIYHIHLLNIFCCFINIIDKYRLRSL